MPRPKSQEESIRAYQRRHFEEKIMIDGYEAFLPKQDKIVEWALLEIVNILGGIHAHLSAISPNRNV